MSLDISSPMELAFECFVKLGLRYICVLREGKFVGLVHRKGMTKYLADQRKQKGPLFGL
jgi:chloride channel 3/4/5